MYPCTPHNPNCTPIIFNPLHSLRLNYPYYPNFPTAPTIPTTPATTPTTPATPTISTTPTTPSTPTTPILGPVATLIRPLLPAEP